MSDKERQTNLQQRLAGQEKADKSAECLIKTIAFAQRDTQPAQAERKIGRPRLYSDEERKKRKAEYFRRYRQEYKEKVKETDKRYRQKYKDKIQEYQSRYYQKHKDKIKENRRRNYQKKKEKLRRDNRAEQVIFDANSPQP